MMIPQTEVKAIIRDLFEEEALALGGLAALHEVEDEFVWQLVRTMDVVRAKTFRRLEDRGAIESDVESSTDVKPHPAIEDFLAKLRRA